MCLKNATIALIACTALLTPHLFAQSAESGDLPATEVPAPAEYAVPTQATAPLPEQGYAPEAPAESAAPMSAPVSMVRRSASVREEYPVEAASSTGEVATIETSHPYVLPRLFSIRTADVLESYSLGFSGSGNVTEFDWNNLQGSIGVGLGGVAELGYQMQDQMTGGLHQQHTTQGHFKLQVISEGRFVPAVAIAAGSNLDKNFSTPLGSSYRMELNTIDFMLAKTLEVAQWKISLYPGVNYFDQRYTHLAGIELPKPIDRSEFAYQMGVTWQKDPSVLFILESRLYEGIDADSTIAAQQVIANRIWENNMGVRYYMRNWLFMDAGIRYFYDEKTGDDDIGIHANISGAIPLKSVFGRIASRFDR
jgi:hypothetical protein